MSSLKTLMIVNGVMVLFVSLVMMQSFNGINASGLFDKMHQQGIVKADS